MDGAEGRLGLGVRELVGFLVVATVAVLPFLGVLGGGFVWDDHVQLELNTHLELRSLAGYWLEAEHSFAEVGRQSRYNPLGWSVFVLESVLSGGTRPAWLFHLTSLIVHGGVAALLFAVLREVVPGAGRAPARPWLLGLALLCAWSPAQAEVACWASARFESLAALALLGGALVVLRSGGVRGALLGGALAATSLFSKESTLGCIALLPLLPALREGWTWRGHRARVLGTAAGAIVVTGLFFGLRARVGVSLPEGLGGLAPLSVLLSELRLLHLAVLPTELSLMRPLPVEASLGDLLAGGGVLFAALSGFQRRGRLSGRLVLAGSLVLVLATLPGAIAAARFELLPDRYVYLGFPGLCLLLAGVFLSLAERDESRRRGRAEFAGLLGLSLLLSVSAIWDLRQVDRWSDDVQLFEGEVALWPEAPQTHYHLGLVLRMRGDHEGAAASLVESTRHGPGLWQTWAELAVTRLDLGDYAGAGAALRAGRQATGNHPRLVQLDELLPEEGRRRGLLPAQPEPAEGRERTGPGLEASSPAPPEP